MPSIDLRQADAADVQPEGPGKALAPEDLATPDDDAPSPAPAAESSEEPDALEDGLEGFEEIPVEQPVAEEEGEAEEEEAAEKAEVSAPATALAAGPEEGEDALLADPIFRLPTSAPTAAAVQGTEHAAGAATECALLLPSPVPLAEGADAATQPLTATPPPASPEMSVLGGGDMGGVAADEEGDGIFIGNGNRGPKAAAGAGILAPPLRGEGDDAAGLLARVARTIDGLVGSVLACLTGGGGAREPAWRISPPAPPRI
jgi:hypothetical protein